MNVDQYAHSAVAPAVWEHRSMRMALANRDLKTVYEHLQRVGVSQRKIAQLTGQSASEVYEILKGRRVMAYDVLVRIANGLGVPRGYLGVAYDESTSTALELAVASGVTKRDERDEVRQLLAHAANVTMGANVDEVSRWWQPIDRQVASAPRQVGRCDIERVEALTAAMRALDYQHGGGACRDAVAAQARWAQQLLTASCAEDLRGRLHLAIADLHNLAGWTSMDVGLFSLARQHFARALEQARHGGDQSLAANVLYRMGRIHLHLDLRREALRFFQLGQIVAQDCGCQSTVAMLSVNEALAYALLGDRQRMLRFVGRAQDEFSRADVANAPCWVRFFGEAELRACVGIAQSSQTDPTKGELAEAIEHLRAAVAMRGPEMARSRAFELTALAIAYLRFGDRDNALRTGREAVSAAASVRSIRVLDRLGHLQDLAVRRRQDAEFGAMGRDIARLRAAE